MASTKRLGASDEKDFPPHVPDTLFFGCVDARLPVAKLGLPIGKVLIHRNIAALIKKDNADMAATLEFAIKAKKISKIIVGGHTNCGGICACVEQHHHLPAVMTYLEPLEKDRKEIAEKFSGDITAQKRALEKRAVGLSLENLLNYECVREAEAKGELALEGWLIDIKNGTRQQLDEKTGKLQSISTMLPIRNEQKI